MSDIPNIMSFLDKHWKPGNLLATDRCFFEWQFVDDDKVNMFIGIDEKTGTIYGTMGVIIYNRKEHPDVSGCTWQTIRSENPILGLDIEQYVFRELDIRYVYVPYMSEKAMRLFKLRGTKPYVMDHYYRINPEIDDYRIAIIQDKSVMDIKDGGYRLEPIASVKEMKKVVPEETLLAGIMSKDYHYIERRYFEHPVYHYDFWKISRPDSTASSVLITREVEQNGGIAAKIIDFYGDVEELSCISYPLDSLMKEKGYEYIDIYSYGVPVTIYEKAGFRCCDETCADVIPNYFHPFVRENVVLHTMMENFVPGLRMFRGDGDQDRPG